jgi:hypothetical protein
MDELGKKKPIERSGIYVHVAFVGDETWYYVGLSKDVKKRFMQHIKNHTDFTKSCWLPAPESELVKLEIKFMTVLQEQGVLLRNTLKPRVAFRWRDLKPIFEDGKAESWCDIESISTELYASDDYELETNYAKRYLDFKNNKDYDDRLLDFLNLYVRKCIFLHHKTEQIFWNITCLNRGLYSKPFEKNIALIRINIHMPETMTVIQNHTIPDDPPIAFNFHVAKDILSNDSIQQIERRFRTEPRPGNYKRTGGDQIQFTVWDIEHAFALLDDHEFVRSIRYGNLRLMRMGLLARRLSQSHCMPLAKDALTRPISG